MMKKTVKRGMAIICGLVLIFSMTACGGNDVSSSAGQDDTAVSVPEKEEDVQASEEVQEPAAEGIVAVPEKFTYTEENGELTITGYDGEVNVLQVPEAIDGKPVVAIGEDAFKENLGNGITKVVIPDSVTLIGKGAFNACKDLVEVELGSGVKVIGSSAFYKVPITNIEIPDSVETIGSSAFSFTHIESVTIPPAVSAIGKHTFAGTNIETLVIPGTVKQIYEYAFSYCESLKTVEIEEGTEIIGEYAFCRCTSLESITLPESATEIDISLVVESASDDGIISIYVKAGSVAEEVFTELYKNSDYYKVIAQ